VGVIVGRGLVVRGYRVSGTGVCQWGGVELLDL